MEMKRRRAMFAKDGTLGRVFLLSVNLTPFMHVSLYSDLRACARFVLRFESKMEGNGDDPCDGRYIFLPAFTSQ